MKKLGSLIFKLKEGSGVKLDPLLPNISDEPIYLQLIAIHTNVSFGASTAFTSEVRAVEVSYRKVVFAKYKYRQLITGGYLVEPYGDDNEQ